MGYETLISGLVKTVVSPQFESMKMNVTHQAWLGDDGQGNDSFGPPVVLRALVDYEGQGQTRYTKAGVLFAQYAKLQFLDAIDDTAANAGQVRDNPIDIRDVITFPDGASAPIVDTGGFANSLTGKPFALAVTLGTIIRGQ